MTTVSQKTGTCGVVAVVVFLALIGVFGRAYWSDSKRNTELAETNDPARIAYLLLDYVADDAHSSVTTDKETISVKYDISSGTTGTAAERLFLDNARDLMQKYFTRFPEVTWVEISATTTFIDFKGNESKATAIRMKMSRSNATGINWKQVPLFNLPALANNYWKHPALDRN